MTPVDKSELSSFAQGIARRHVLLAAGGATASALAPWPAGAQDAAYPNKPVKVIVPWPAGGATDVLARILAERLTSKLGHNFFVDNRPGATGYIGTQAVISSPADGYTLLVMAPSLHTFHAAVAKTIPFDAVKDFTPVSAFAQFPSVLVVPANSPYNTVSDLLADARKRPEKLTFGSFGNGSAAHMIPELLSIFTKTKFLHVPYKGAAPAITDLLAGRLDFMMDSLPSPMPHIRSGRLKALAVTSKARSTLLPGVPTIAETMPGFDVILCIGLGAPAGTPASIANKLHDAVRQISLEPAYVEKLANLGSEPSSSGSPEAFRTFLSSQRELWTKVATQSGITLD
ncbi:MAG: hypothetical protein DI563_03610 [Variovorax paradoxus]|uniref:Tripartite tricarboxylate transporter substrate binding protein n=1 Tax=Variovorax paradoxus TaxID=34073 RepID=A0A2W5QK81_VARPD|nr:MAG: hypothetical protein DI563_03610 [Variovorax paradoxus]